MPSLSVTQSIYLIASCVFALCQTITASEILSNGMYVSQFVANEIADNDVSFYNLNKYFD